ncbi:MAG: IS1096 element passenger TnpR family protein [Candidatus Latescibacterota bacterium]
MRENPNSSYFHDNPVRVYTLEVSLASGPLKESFYEENPVISRSIQIRGNQTLEDLHDVIFTAFDREDDSMYEFQLGKNAHDRSSGFYVLPSEMLRKAVKGKIIAGDVTQTRIDSLDLKRNETFSYLFDFEDDWMHDIRVAAIENEALSGKFPRVISRVGESPAQYPDWENADEEYAEENEWNVSF